MTVREVRQFGDRVIHRTTATARSGFIATACGAMVNQTADPREWDGPNPGVTECPTCFAEPKAEHGSRPQWPIYPCHHHRFLDRVHYHVTDTGEEGPGPGDTGHNSTVYESVSRHTVQGKRFQYGAPDPDDTAAVYPCVVGHTTNNVHFHSRPTSSTDEWTDTRPGAISTSGTPDDHSATPPAGFTRYCGPDGTPYRFSRRPDHQTTTSQPCDTNPEESSTMPDTTTLQPGDIVRSSRNGMPPSGLRDSHYYLVIGRGLPESEERILTVVHPLYEAGGVGSRGWRADDRRVPQPYRSIVDGAGMWFFHERYLTKVPDAQATDLPTDMELLRRRIQTEAFGSEPVLPCTISTHRTSLCGDPHRHSHGPGDTTPSRMARGADEASIYIPEPGLWSSTPSLVTLPSASQGCDTESEALTGENIHPVTRDALQGVRSVVLTSKPGVLSGSNLVFGCQTIPINVVQRQSGSSMAFTPEGVVVTSRATVSPDLRTLNIGDRNLSLRDINDYTTSIVVDEAAPVPVTPVINAVVMEHGYYGCREHAGEVLHITEGVGGDVLVRVVFDSGNRPTGTTGQRRGFTSGGSQALLGHRPVAGCTSNRIMNVDQRSAYSLVPITESEVENYSGFTTAHTDSTLIVRCNERGEVI